MNLEEYIRRMEHFRQRVEEEIDPDEIRIQDNDTIIIQVTDMGSKDTESIKVIGNELLDNTGLRITFDWRFE